MLVRNIPTSEISYASPKSELFMPDLVHLSEWTFDRKRIFANSKPQP